MNYNNPMADNLNPSVNEYIKKLPKWQQGICRQVRALIHKADAGVEETIKRGWPFFVLKGNIAALQATKDHVNILIYDPIAPDPNGVINQGRGNKTARAVQVYEGDDLNKNALLKLFKAVIANNKAGGWRKLKSK
jgi:hypothetical protein